MCRYRAGAAYVVFGRAEGDFAASYDLGNAAVIDGKSVTSFLGLRAQDALGIGVGPAGDFNGDGIADVWVRKKIQEGGSDLTIYVYMYDITIHSPQKHTNTTYIQVVSKMVHTSRINIQDFSQSEGKVMQPVLAKTKKACICRLLQPTAVNNLL